MTSSYRNCLNKDELGFRSAKQFEFRSATSSPSWVLGDLPPIMESTASSGAGEHSGASRAPASDGPRRWPAREEHGPITATTTARGTTTCSMRTPTALRNYTDDAPPPLDAPGPPLLFYPSPSSGPGIAGAGLRPTTADATMFSGNSSPLRLTLAEEHLQARLEQIQHDNLTEQRKSQLLDRRSRLLETEVGRLRAQHQEQAERAERELKGSRVTFEQLLEERKLELFSAEKEVAVLQKNLQKLALDKSAGEEERKNEVAWYQQVLTAREHALQELLEAFDRGLKAQQENEKKVLFFQDRAAVLEAEAAASVARFRESDEHVRELQRLVGSQKKIQTGLEERLLESEQRTRNAEQEEKEGEKRVLLLLAEKEQLRQDGIAVARELRLREEALFKLKAECEGLGRELAEHRSSTANTKERIVELETEVEKWVDGARTADTRAQMSDLEAHRLRLALEREEKTRLAMEELVAEMKDLLSDCPNKLHICQKAFF